MEVFRISSEKYAGKLTASGKPARWNKNQQEVLYTGASRSLVTLESLVHENGIPSALKYRIMIISLAEDEKLYTQVPIKKLPKDWREHTAYSKLQETGSKWYIQQQSLVLKVPSAIIPQEFNYIINTKHPDFHAGNISLVRTEDYFWDKRLF